ncbi:dnaJ homolog subfamily C member 12 isoform X5 [Labrus bergylta]|uniref:DnaJ (Hsp40) homolog, subfamily C, member 12 n=1 Tax=Labrus bergylta TaxID=56723 RepID=A0A3Q3M9X7_9LABR|nr:dnaJ homolog subfamily C member 12 [Labrus bergylta]
MEAVLNYKTDDLEDYYGLLGCDELSTTEQILSEYKIRALACHPDKNLQNPGAVADFQKLQEAKDVLCNQTKRKNYDLWKISGITVSFHNWCALNDSVKTSVHWAVRDRKEPMLEASKAQVPGSAQSARTSLCDALPSSSDYCHQLWRLVPDSSTSLLQRFRNYEI